MILVFQDEVNLFLPKLLHVPDFITAIETLIKTEMGTRLVGYFCDQPDHVFWGRIWVGKATGCSNLNWLLFSGSLCSFRGK